MTLRVDDVRLLLTAVHEGSVSRAAARSFITQQGLSSAIRRVEASVGCELLERHPAGVRLTARGREMYELLSEIVSCAEEASRLAARATSDETTLVVGVTSPAALGSISRLHEALPHVRIRVRQLNFDQVDRTLAHDLADVVVSFGPLHVSGWQSVPLYAETLGVLFPRTHRLARERVVTPLQIMDEVFLTGRNLPLGWLDVGRLDAFRGGAAARLGDPLLTDVRNPAEANEMVAARLALVTAPASHVGFFPHPQVKMVPLDMPAVCDVVALNGVREQGTAKRKAADTVISLLQAMNRRRRMMIGA